MSSAPKFEARLVARVLRGEWGGDRAGLCDDISNVRIMPERGRIDAPAALHHIVIRGIEPKPIFKKPSNDLNSVQRFKIRAIEDLALPFFEL